ncbi:hypothetical protein SISNIDRAFT_429220 [Sistotremastrum niveocremeum HHB9708]|uniref:Reverse transcriptase domain-containing protein n=2 Tax=Sistotremastraceae TaxID=3402574 RepID=A0A164TPN2_9AGAM|nr:hypothetical protein SISNIDRAFT_429220 [Sistotremastrum niveocremeum HHB9708]KZT42207.1 hypothetical protein SISSUDRAFT_1016351 [Sistotremastrum suecicum HHB10207 ss-3]
MSGFAPYPSRGRGAARARGIIRGAGRGRVSTRSLRGINVELDENLMQNFHISPATQTFLAEIKQQELRLQRRTYEERLQDTLQKADEASDHVEKVEAMVEGGRSLTDHRVMVDNPGLDSKLKDMQSRIGTAKMSPGTLADASKNWMEALRGRFEADQEKFRYATLFNNLLTDWYDSAAHDVSASHDYIHVEERGVSRARADLVSVISQPRETDMQAFEAYLLALFSSESATSALTRTRSRLQRAGARITQMPIFLQELPQSIETLLVSDSLSVTDRAKLRDVLCDNLALADVCGVLNMMLTRLYSWSWESTTVEIHLQPLRTEKDGYSAYLGIDLLNALFLHHLGVCWQAEIKVALSSIYRDGEVWKEHSMSPPSNLDLSMIDDEDGPDGIVAVRTHVQEQHLFLTQFQSQGNPKKPPTSSHEPFMNNPTPLSDSSSKMLHVINADRITQDALHQDFCVAAGELPQFERMLPHDVILFTLAFFGVPQPWIDFFAKHLAVPLKFAGDETPISNVASRGIFGNDPFGAIYKEVVLFVLSFAINQSAEAIPNHRIRDTIYMWGLTARCERGWAELQRFAALLGISIDLSRSGSASTCRGAACALPNGNVHWGSLTANDESHGKFVVEYASIDAYVEKIRPLLSHEKSVKGWVSIWNEFNTSLVRDLGGVPVKGFGLAHLEAMVSAIRYAQNAALPGCDNGPCDHLRKMISDKYQMDDIPHGWFHFPMESGGLQVYDPVIQLMTIRDSLVANPEQAIHTQMETDKARYEALRQRWSWKSTSTPNLVPFMTFDAYKNLRELALPEWASQYRQLLDNPMPICIGNPLISSVGPLESNGQVDASIGTFRSMVSEEWHHVAPYWQWVVLLHGEEVQKRFGNLIIVDQQHVSLALMDHYRKSKVCLD